VAKPLCMRACMHRCASDVALSNKGYSHSPHSHGSNITHPCIGVTRERGVSTLSFRKKNISASWFRDEVPLHQICMCARVCHSPAAVELQHAGEITASPLSPRAVRLAQSRSGYTPRGCTQGFPDSWKCEPPFSFSVRHTHLRVDRFHKGC
jgi:hypothetical protein